MDESRPGYLRMKFQVAQQFVHDNGEGPKRAIPMNEMVAIIEGQPTEEQKAKAEKVVKKLHEAWKRDYTPTSPDPGAEIHEINRKVGRIVNEAALNATYTGRKVVDEEKKITKTR